MPDSCLLAVMDPVRLGYDAVRAYVYALVLASAATVAWLFAPDVASAPEVAGTWLAIGGFGLLVMVTFALTQYGRYS
jgi:preprotein translocase subunit SecY